MKKILLFIIVPVFAFSCNRNGNTENNDLQKLNLRGSVKTITEYTHDGFSVLYTFDENGVLLSRQAFNPNGTLAWVSDLSAPTDNDTEKKEYDDAGNLTRHVMYYESESIVTTYRYNEKHQLVEQVECRDTINQISTTWQFEYDNKGDIIKETCTYADGSATQLEYSYQYDKQDNWIIRQTIDNNNNTRFFTERKIEYY